MANALCLLANDFEDIEAVSVIDILRRGGVQVTTASIDSSLSVLSSHGIRMEADATLESLADEKFDALILPGGKGTEKLRESKAVIERLRRQKEEGGLICAICAAPTVLVDAGVLEPGQHVTCYPSCIVDLDRPSAGVPVVADDTVITGQAPGSAMLFALVILQALTSDYVAHKIARALVSDVLD